MSLTLAPTHLVRYRVGNAVARDGLALDLTPEALPQQRRFLPGHLPCGECPLCRRALVGACPSVRHPLEGLDAEPLELPARFLAPIDEPLDAPRLPDETVVLAGPTAFALTALATAALAPGDVAIWLGAGPVASLGRALTAHAGGHGFALADPSVQAVPALRAEIASAVVEAGLAHGAQKRIVLLTELSPASWATACAVADPGTLFVVLGPGGGVLPSLTLPAEARLVQLSAYHPDFLPEAFAALRRDPQDHIQRRIGRTDEEPGRDVVITPLL